jgi:hypothetical protein
MFMLEPAQENVLLMEREENDRVLTVDNINNL